MKNVTHLKCDPAEHDAQAPDVDELHQVRELLFGQQSRQQQADTQRFADHVDARFSDSATEAARLDRRLAEEAEARDRRDVELNELLLEQRRVIDALSDRLDQEKAELVRLNAASEKSRASDVARLETALSSSVNAERERMAKLLQGVATQLLKTTK